MLLVLTVDVSRTPPRKSLVPRTFCSTLMMPSETALAVLSLSTWNASRSARAPAAKA